MRTLPDRAMFTYADALDLGWTMSALKNAVRRGRVVRIRRGVYATTGGSPAMQARAAALTHPGAVVSDAGHWHLGELTGEPGKFKSTFPATYRPLSDLGLLKQLEVPVWLKIFASKFGVNLSSRTANYDTKCQIIKSFHEFYHEAVR